jgi:hypothetical protein
MQSSSSFRNYARGDYALLYTFLSSCDWSCVYNQSSADAAVTQLSPAVTEALDLACKKQSSPATRHGGAWGKGRYSSYSFTTSELDEGEWSTSRPGRALPLVPRFGFGERRWNDILTGENRRTRRKTCLSATLSTTNPTSTDLGANPDLRGERPATNDLSHGPASQDVTRNLTMCVPLQTQI